MAPMDRSTKDDWLAPEAGDLEEVELQDVPVEGKSVKIRALSATAANAATSQAVSTEEVRGQTRMKVDSVRLDILRFAAGVVEPKMTIDEATVISGKFGKAFNRVIREINRLSGIDEETTKEIEARFQGVGTGEARANGADPSAESDGPDQPLRTGPKPTNVGD